MYHKLKASYSCIQIWWVFTRLSRLIHFISLFQLIWLQKILLFLNIQKINIKFEALRSRWKKFQDFDSRKQNIKIFINPFIMRLAVIVGYPPNIQLAFVELLNHDALKNLFANKLSSQFLDIRTKSRISSKNWPGVTVSKKFWINICLWKDFYRI